MSFDSLPVARMAQSCLPDTILGGISFNGLSRMANDPDSPLNALTEAFCTKCEKPIGRVLKLFEFSCACDQCRDQWTQDEQIKKCKLQWELLCPAGYRDTTNKHPDFPTALWAKAPLLGWKGDLKDRSLVLLGDTRAGKTRSAMLLLKRALLSGNTVAILWPEELRELSGLRTLEQLRALAAHNVILMDDTIQAAMGEDKLIEIVKQLVDLIMRNKHRFILTTQVGGDDSDASKYGGPTSAQVKRASALYERIRESAETVSFPKVAKEIPF